MDDQSEWTIGELANAAGVTVRALHHYDEIGLSFPLTGPRADIAAMNPKR